MNTLNNCQIRERRPPCRSQSLRALVSSFQPTWIVSRISRQVRLLASYVFLLSALTAQAKLRVIEESAIPYTGFLSKADFDQRFPGELFENPNSVESGWYVVYEHQSLNYYFGPMPLESTGRDYLAQLRTIVDEAVAQRPSIQEYILELKQAPFDSGEGTGAESSAQAGEYPESESAESAGSSAGGSPPSSSFNIWKMIKGLFGL